MAEVTRVAEQLVAEPHTEPRGRSLARLALISPLASMVRSKSQVRRRKDAGRMWQVMLK